MRKMTIVKCGSATLLFLVCAFAIQESMLGKTLSNAFVPAKDKGKAASAIVSEIEQAEQPDTIDTEEAELHAATGQLYHDDRLNFKRLSPLPPELIDTETLWLARCIFSETKRKEEQELIAWIIRNRVETRYRGRRSYRDVVLDPMQFSAFNPGTRTRQYYSNLTPGSKVPGWQSALRIAHEVRHADPNEWRPFSARTRHFYSEQSMVGSSHPNWATGMKPVSPKRPYRIEPRRFRFFEGVS